MDKRGGGVAIYIDDKLSCKLIPTVSMVKDCIESVFVEIIGPTISKFLSGKLEHRGTGGNKKLQSRAIDL